MSLAVHGESEPVGPISIATAFGKQDLENINDLTSPMVFARD